MKRFQVHYQGQFSRCADSPRDWGFRGQGGRHWLLHYSCLGAVEWLVDIQNFDVHLKSVRWQFVLIEHRDPSQEYLMQLHCLFLSPMGMKFRAQSEVSRQVKKTGRLFGSVGTKHGFSIVENLGLILGLRRYQLYIRRKRACGSVNQSISYYF